MITVLLLSLSLGLNAHAELDFVSYLKRNHELLKKGRAPQEKVAFKEKQIRSVASVPGPEESKSEGSAPDKNTGITSLPLQKSTPPPSPSGGESEMPAESDSEMGPNR